MTQYIQPTSYERLPASTVPEAYRQRFSCITTAKILMERVIPEPVRAEEHTAPVADIAAQTVVKAESAVEPVAATPVAPEVEAEVARSVDEAMAHLEAVFAEAASQSPVPQEV